MKTLFVVFCVTLTLSNAFADVIYDNQAVINSGAGSDSAAGSFLADDFVLQAGHETITAIRWTGTYWNSDTPTPSTDDFSIQFFADSGGQPGSLLNNIHIGAVGRTDTGTDIFIFQTTRNLYSYTAAIAPLSLTPGVTYWLSIVNNTSADANDNWDWSIATTGGNTAFRSSFFSPWTTTSFVTDFQLIPEPASLALLGAGLCAAAAVRRRRFASVLAGR